jgi:hypothetical protein
VELGIPFDLAAVTADIRVLISSRWQFASDALESTPPLRLHLLHQSLLI